MDISVLLPVRNELKNLQILIPKLINELDKQSFESEIILLEDSKEIDNKKEFISNSKKVFIRQIDCKDKNSYSSALKFGFIKAYGDYILVMDADTSHNPKYLSLFFKYKDDYDIVVASRFIGNRSLSGENAISVFLSKIINKTLKRILGLKISDITGSYKLYKSEIIKDLKLLANYFDIHFEVIFRAYNNKKNLRIKEFPYFFEKRRYGRSKRRNLKYCYNLLLMIIRLKILNNF